jgi:hypothetical protein
MCVKKMVRRKLDDAKRKWEGECSCQSSTSSFVEHSSCSVQQKMVIGRPESCRAAINCRMASGTKPGSWRSSKKIFCRLGNTSVTVGTIRGTGSDSSQWQMDEKIPTIDCFPSRPSHLAKAWIVAENTSSSM